MNTWFLNANENKVETREDELQVLDNDFDVGMFLSKPINLNNKSYSKGWEDWSTHIQWESSD